MAKLRRRSSDSFIFNDGNQSQSTTETKRTSPRKHTVKAPSDDQSTLGGDPGASNLVSKSRSTAEEPKQRRQIRLAPLNQRKCSSAGLVFKLPATTLATKKKTSPQKARLDSRQELLKQPPPVVVEEIDVDETIGCDEQCASSDSDFELPSPKDFLKFRTSPAKKAHARNGIIDIDSRDEDIVPYKRPNRSTSRPGYSTDKENRNDDVPRFSSPCNKDPLGTRPNTPPPQSFGEGKLLSPSKRAPKIPTPPLRPSLDAFWDVKTINEWNDQYSPRKEWKSPKKLQSSSSDHTPTASPRKQPLSSPTKRTKAEIEAKRTWDSMKDGIARTFLSELDKIITDCQISKLAESTGGVTITWSKTLNSTAGRANWRRETVKKRRPDGTSEVTTIKHFASIELAEKVIDQEDRLLNVLAHEFCHLCNFMISNIRDQPHGRQFKLWGAKVTKAFSHRGIKVTTKHTYEIEYRYIWSCGECEQEYKRHSKSIDPTKHTCGKCRGKLTQVKPVPRKNANADSGYTKFVKDNFQRIKDELGPGKTQGEIMEAVARHYREDKAKKAQQPSNKVVDDVVRRLAFVTLD